jgi:hypothetical protein
MWSVQRQEKSCGKYGTWRFCVECLAIQTTPTETKEEAMARARNDAIALAARFHRREAMVVRAIFGSVSGAMGHTPRGMADRIYDALGELDVPAAKTGFDSVGLPSSWDDVEAED